MFKELFETVNQSLGSIDILISQRIERNKTSNVQCGSWKLDDNMKVAINDIKAQSEILSKTCIKLVLLSTKKPTVEILNSILCELHNQCRALIMAYL